ncbi:Uncharacterised protein g2708 [Pycnogonum litorale]
MDRFSIFILLVVLIQGSVFVESELTSIVSSRIKRTWHATFENCSMEKTTGGLITVQSVPDLRFVGEYMKTEKMRTAWVGAKSDDKGLFFWVNGDRLIPSSDMPNTNVLTPAARRVGKTLCVFAKRGNDGVTKLMPSLCDALHMSLCNI